MASFLFPSRASVFLVLILSDLRRGAGGVLTSSPGMDDNHIVRLASSSSSSSTSRAHAAAGGGSKWKGGGKVWKDNCDDYVVVVSPSSKIYFSRAGDSALPFF